MLSEEKKQRNWSMLISSQDITQWLYPVMSNADIQFQLIQTFSTKSKWQQLKLLKSMNWALQKKIQELSYL